MLFRLPNSSNLVPFSLLKERVPEILFSSLSGNQNNPVKNISSVILFLP
jgi:hypothetical protein